MHGDKLKRDEAPECELRQVCSPSKSARGCSGEKNETLLVKVRGFISQLCSASLHLKDGKSWGNKCEVDLG